MGAQEGYLAGRLVVMLAVLLHVQQRFLCTLLLLLLPPWQSFSLLLLTLRLLCLLLLCLLLLPRLLHLAAQPQGLQLLRRLQLGTLPFRATWQQQLQAVGICGHGWVR